MKLKLFINVAFIVFIITGRAFAQNHAYDNDAIKMLRQFYSSDCTIKLTIKDQHKSDSLQKIYCTEKVQKEIKNDFGDGYDFLTSDWGISKESMKTMIIQKAPGKSNIYLVSYITDTFPVSPKKAIKRKISLYVGVVKESTGYKISSVNDSSKAK